jgi:hypothetical protein
MNRSAPVAVSDGATGLQRCSEDAQQFLNTVGDSRTVDELQEQASGASPAAQLRGWWNSHEA